MNSHYSYSYYYHFKLENLMESNSFDLTLHSFLIKAQIYLFIFLFRIDICPIEKNIQFYNFTIIVK